ncbi:Aldo keto reductase [Phellopilus nigrolimitatus]|nr:Aldo keto reductase [Phellopilus nigrolimitatus]
MPASKSVKLNTGAVIPTVGLGTWRSAPGQVELAVAHALKFGYRHIDTAAAYGNENEVGQGLAASGVKREEIFLTTKLNNNDHANPEKALDSSLKNLGTSYLDLWLMHWPAPMTSDLSGADKSIDWLDTWKAMEKIYAEHPEKVKAIGVSNFSVEFLNRLFEYLESQPTKGKVVPAVNQIELHPSCPQHDVVAFCTAHNIVLTAYSPLGSDGAPLLANAVVKALAEKKGVAPANLLVSLQANRPGVTVLPKSVSPGRIESNFTIVDLSDEEVAELQSIDKDHHFRACNPSWTGWGSLGFPDCK